MKRATPLLLLFILQGCAGWTINGIPTERFRCAEPKEYTELAAGVGTSILIHWLSHVAYLELSGIEWKQDGLQEITYPENQDQRKWIGRIGFIGQLACGTALKYSPLSESWFATGYHLGSFTEISTHPVIWGWKNNSDLGSIGETAEIEWAVYTLASTWLLDPRLLDKEAIDAR